MLSAWRLCASFAAGLLVQPAFASPLAHRVELGGGASIPIYSDHRRVYGTGPTFSVGYAARIAEAAWFALDVGASHASGNEYTVDPTFDMPDASYWIVPIQLGFQANAVAPPYQERFGLYFGLGFETLITSWKEPRGRTYRSPAFGLSFDLRPEIPLRGSWSLWLRERFLLVQGVTYESSVPRLNYSASQLQIGLSLGSR
jgi:hypothetical protein